MATLVAATKADARQVDPPVDPPVVQLAVLMARVLVREPIARVATVLRRIDHVVTATDPIWPAPLAMATVPIHHVPRVMAIRVHVATVIRAQRAPAEIDPILLVPHGTEIRVHREAMVTDLIRRAHLAMEIRVLVVMAIVHTRLELPAMEIGLIRRAPLAMEIRVHVSRVAMATVLVALRALGETDRIRLVRLVTVTAPIHRVPLVTVTDPIRLALLAMATRVRAATATVLVALRAPAATGHTRLVLPEMETGRTLRVPRAMAIRVRVVMGTGLALTDHGATAPMVPGPAGTGSLRAVSVVRSGRR